MGSFLYIIMWMIMILAVMLQGLDMVSTIRPEVHTYNDTKLALDELRQVFSISKLNSKDYYYISGNGSEIRNGILETKQHFHEGKLCAFLSGADDSSLDSQVNMLNLSVLQEVSNIRDLWLLPGYNVAGQTKIYITYLDLFKRYDINLAHLSELHLHVPLGSNIDSLKNLLDIAGRNLKVLSLKNIFLFDDINDLKILF